MKAHELLQYTAILKCPKNLFIRHNNTKKCTLAFALQTAHKIFQHQGWESLQSVSWTEPLDLGHGADGAVQWHTAHFSLRSTSPQPHPNSTLRTWPNVDQMQTLLSPLLLLRPKSYLTKQDMWLSCTLSRNPPLCGTFLPQSHPDTTLIWSPAPVPG